MTKQEKSVNEKTNDSIYVALYKMQGSLTAVKKERQGYNFRYADLSDIWKVIRKPLSDNGLSLIQLVHSEEGRNYIITRLYHVSGEMIESKTLIEFTATKFQEVGTALTYYRRYALSAMLGIVSDDDVDDNLENGKKIYEKQKDPTISTQQLKVIEDLINGHEDIRLRINKSFGNTKNIPLPEYTKVVKTIKQLIEDKEKRNGL
jgi:hypothetical protein